MACTRGNSYIIQAGDTLSMIAQNQLGDGNRWREIMKPDGTPFTEADASNLQVGQEICLPANSPPVENDPPPVTGGNGGSATGYKIVGYFENWAQYRPKGNGYFLPEQVDPSLLTHINFAFAVFGFITKSVDPENPRLTGDYKLQPIEWNEQDALYPELQKLKEKNPNLKTLLSIGGWSFNDPEDINEIGTSTYQLFSQMASSSAGRQEFISSAIEYAKKYGFDGIDLDWEYPGYIGRGGTPEDLPNFLVLVQEFRSAIGGQNLLLTMASPAIVPTGTPEYYHNNPNEYFEWLRQCTEQLDWLNVMSYDYHGAWPSDTVTGVNAPLPQDSTPDGSFSVKNTVEAYLEAGIPKEKMVLGMGTYGRTFKVTGSLTASDSGPGKPYSGPGSAGPGTRIPGILAYYEIKSRLSSGDLTRGWDEPTLTPYASSQTGDWVSYDDEESLAYKVSYAIEKGLAGAMVWAIGQDDFSNGYPLLKNIKDILDHPEKRPKLPLSLVKSLFSESSDNKFGEPQNYDPGKQPAVAVNKDNVVVEVHQGQVRLTTVDLAYRAGEVVKEKNQIDWNQLNDKKEQGKKYDTGNNPSVAINNKVVVEVHETGTGEIWYHTATLKPNPSDKDDRVDFNEGFYYDKGDSPSVAINDDGIVVEVHHSDGNLWYRAGEVKGKNINWQPVNDSGSKIGNYNSGNTPSVAINNNGVVVEVHENETGEIYYHIAFLKSDKPNNWVEFQPGIRYDKGYSPSVAINDNGIVVVIHNSDESTLVYCTGQVNTNLNKIDWSKPQTIKYDDKKLSRPKVACNTTLAVETHEEYIRIVKPGLGDVPHPVKEHLGLSYSILPLPKRTSQADWIEAQGANSYCYYSIDSHITGGKNYSTNKRIRVDESAPYVCAILTKNHDSVDFPTGATLKITGADGTVYDQQSNTDNLLVIMSGSSLQNLIVKDPIPGDWLITLTVPKNVEFHFDFQTLPSENVSGTIENTLASAHKTPEGNQRLEKRGLESLGGDLMMLSLISPLALEIPLGPVAAALTFLGMSIISLRNAASQKASPAQAGYDLFQAAQRNEQSRESEFGKSIYSTLKDLIGEIAKTLTKTAKKRPNQGDIRIATWNVGTRFTLDGQVVTVTNAKFRMALFAEYGAAIGIHIIAFQEAPRNLTQNQINAIVGATGYSWQYMGMEYPTGTGRANNRGTEKAYLVLYDPNVLTINRGISFFSDVSTQQSYIDQFIDPSSRYQCRPPVMINFSVVNSINSLYFVTWHNEETPRSLSAYLLYVLSEHIASQTPPSAKWVVAGDFNWANVDRISANDMGGRTTGGQIFVGWVGISGGTVRGRNGDKDHILTDFNSAVEVTAAPTFESDAGHLALIADVS